MELNASTGLSGRTASGGAADTVTPSSAIATAPVRMGIALCIVASSCLRRRAGERQRENVLPGELRPRVGNSGRDGRRARLADAGGLLVGRHDVTLHIRHLVDAQ